MPFKSAEDKRRYQREWMRKQKGLAYQMYFHLRLLAYREENREKARLARRAYYFTNRLKEDSRKKIWRDKMVYGDFYEVAQLNRKLRKLL